jgi:hypothetical protein
MNEGATEDEYKVCWRILSIEPDGKGDGCVKMGGIINYGTYNLELKTPHEFNREQLNGNFVVGSYDFTILVYFIKAVNTVTLIALQGLSKAVTAPAKALAKKLLLKEIKRRTSKRLRIMVFRAVYHKLLKIVPQATLQFCKTLAMELNKLRHTQDVIRQLSGRAPTWGIFKPALLTASAAVVGTVIDGVFSASIGREIRTSKAFTKIEKEVAEAIVGKIMTAPAKIVVTALANAKKTSDRTRETFLNALEKELNKGFKDLLNDAITKELPKYAAGKA